MIGRSSYLVVGVFVSAGIVAIVAIILFLAGNRSTAPTARYIVLFERDINGLTLGAPVRYLGVDVGNVVAISLDTDRSTKVRVDVEVLQSTPVTSLSYASLAFQGVTGVAFVSLASDKGVGDTLRAFNDMEYPIISARNSGLAALLSDGPEITHKIVELLDRANQLLGSENQDRLTHTLKMVEQLTETLAAQDETIGNLPSQIGSVLNRLESTLAGLQETVDDSGPGVVATLRSFNKASDNLVKISGRLDQWLISHEEDIRHFVNSALGKTPDLVAETRTTLRELEKLVIDLQEDASQLIYEPQSDAVAIEH